MRNDFARVLPRVLRRAMLIAYLGLVSACVDVGGDFVVELADLTVSWTIDGVDDPALCNVYGIDVWDVTAEGPEIQIATIDCYDEFWIADFRLLAGDYFISVAAVNVIANIDVGFIGADVFDLFGREDIALDLKAGLDI